MKDNEYYKSGKHVKNILSAKKLAIEKIKYIKIENVKKYYLNPKLCKNCNKPISYEKKNRSLFCCKSCAVKFNNKLRKLSPEIKEKISKTLKTFYLDNKSKRNNIFGFCKLFKITCQVCNKCILVSHKSKNNKSCGNMDCIMQLKIGEKKYPNVNKKLSFFYNKFENKNVVLESSWEVRIAILLTERNIKWMRPKFLKWQDSTNKIRRYFPDFYLLDYDVYLDPKNPYCIEKDKEKLNQIQKQIKLIFGNPSEIEKWIMTNCN